MGSLAEIANADGEAGEAVNANGELGTVESPDGLESEDTVEEPTPWPGFAEPVDVYVWDRGYAGTMTAADLDGDDAIDLVVMTGPTLVAKVRFPRVALWLLRNNGHGTFEPATVLTTIERTGPSVLAVGDLDGDGDIDVIGANPSGNVLVLLNAGDGTFPEQRWYDIASGVWHGGLAVGDVNGDGPLDILVASELSGNVSVLLNEGDGTFPEAINFPATGPAAPELYDPSLALGDLDADGDLDAVTANGDLSVSVLMNDGNAGFASPVQYSVDFADALTINDFDSDGDLDIVAGGLGSVSVLLNDGNATFETGSSFEVGPLVNSAGWIAAGDFDHDGDVDLALLERSRDLGNLRILANAGDATFTTVANLDVGEGPYSRAVGDFDGDGDLDIAITNDYAKKVSLLQNQGGP